jgi:hypothetical protein
MSGMRWVTTDALPGLPAVHAGRHTPAVEAGRSGCAGRSASVLSPVRPPGRPPDAAAAPAERSRLSEMPGAAALSAVSCVAPPASSALSIASFEHRLRRGTLGAAAGERRSDAAVTGREATSVAYSHASFTCRASCSALSSTTLPSTHSPSLHTEELTLEPTLGRSPPL